MISFVGLTAMFVSALLIAGADALIKKVSTQGNFYTALMDPWMIVILSAYIIQILIVIYVFINQGELAIYANIFIVFYSILMVLAGVFLFKEELTLLQYVGIVLALSGAVLLNSGK
jgi:drug/metabolite transporter (DMT)-like permease